MFSYEIDDDLQIRLLELRDAEELYETTDVSREHLREWLPWVDGTLTPADTREFIQAALHQFTANNGFQLGLSWQGRLVGCVGYHYMDWANRRTSIGYWLAHYAQGNGLMTRATKALVHLAFSRYDLNRVEIRVAPENHKSQAIPKRLGFTKEGQIRDAEWLYDHYVDHVVYSMLRKDWQVDRHA